MPQAMTAPATAAAVSPVARRPRLAARLRDLFEDVAGVELGNADGAAAFVELGLDSLTLTQAALQVKKQFAVAITFRQLMEKYRSFDTLAEYLDATLPPEPAASTAIAATSATPANVAAPALTMPTFQPLAAAGPGSSLVQQVIAQQMQLMAQQLALLAGSPAASPDASGMAAANPAVFVEQVPAAAPTAQPASTEESGAVRYDVKKAFGAIARIHTQANEVTSRQRVRLDTFVRRYIERTRKSRDYTVRHRPHLADPRVVNGFRNLLDGKWLS